MVMLAALSAGSVASHMRFKIQEVEEEAAESEAVASSVGSV